MNYFNSNTTEDKKLEEIILTKSFFVKLYICLRFRVDDAAKEPKWKKTLSYLITAMPSING